MKTVSIDTEYDYCKPFLATVTHDDVETENGELYTEVYRTNVLSQRRKLRELCVNKNIRKVFHHATGDIFQLRNINIEVAKPYECTLIASNLVDENYKSRNLKKLAQVHLGIETHESNRLKSVIQKYKKLAVKEGRRFKWSDIPDEYIIPYAKRDPEYTLMLWYYWQEPLEASKELYEFEKSLIPLIVDLQSAGMRIHRPLCRQRIREYSSKLEELQEGMEKYIRDNNISLEKELNPRSPKQIQKLILAMGLEEVGDVDAMSLMPKTDKKSLQKLQLDNEFFKILLKYRFFSKHLTTYYDPLYNYYTSETNDIAHFLMYQTGAKTGRFSAELIQTFPKPEENKLAGELHEVRKAVIPKRGKALLCKDYEQQEARLFCHYANCERMIEIINKKTGTKGFDIYIETAELLFGKLFERDKLRKALRAVSKTDFLGGIYGIGQSKLITSTVGMLYEKFDKSVVEEIGVNQQWAYESLQRFYELYPVREFMQECMRELYGKGYIDLEFNSSLMKFKRRYNIPKEFAYKGPNAKIQGTAAYIIKCAMKRCAERIKRERWQNKVEMIMQVHDELIFEVDDDYDFIREVDKAMGEEMDDWATFKVPITTSGKWSNKSWGDVKELT